jgi:hypothetical protein
MAELWIALAGITGTIASAFLTSYSQRLSVRATQLKEDERRLRDQRVEAITQFASHLVDYRRAEIHAWWQVERSKGELSGPLDFDDVPAAKELRSVRSAAWAASYRVRLLWDDPEILKLAEDLLRQASGIEHAVSSERVKREADLVRARIAQLVDLAGNRLKVDTSGKRAPARARPTD